MTEPNANYGNNTPATIASMQQFSFFNPEQFETMQRVAKMFANSELVPDMYKISANNPENKAVSNCVIAIDIANRIEANILMVMQNLVIIYGRPSWSSKFLISTVNTCGRFEPLQYKFTSIGTIKDFKYQEYVTTWVNNKKKVTVVDKVLVGPIDNIQCVAFTTKQGGSAVLESAPVSVEMAINEGWYTKKGSKWPTMTKQMLIYRSATFWTNAYAPELSMGMKTTEEVHDIVDVPEKDYEVLSGDKTKKSEQEVAEEIKTNANSEEVDLPEEPEEVKAEEKSFDDSELD